MLFLSRQLTLRDSAALGNPTIIIITDREDLDTQASNAKSFPLKYSSELAIKPYQCQEVIHLTQISWYQEELGDLQIHRYQYDGQNDDVNYVLSQI